MPTTCAGPGAAFDWGRVTALYSDGGVIGPNPSARGGTWAYCLVTGIGGRAFGSGGCVTPAEIGLPEVTNNLTELLALLLGLERAPDGWAGDVFTDSLVTLRRFTKGGRKEPKFNGIPDALVGRVRAAKGRLGAYTLTLLGGHPNRNELVAGVRKDGMPVSAHNVWCDRRCGEAAEAHQSSLVRAGEPLGASF